MASDPSLRQSYGPEVAIDRQSQAPELSPYQDAFTGPEAVLDEKNAKDIPLANPHLTSPPVDQAISFGQPRQRKLLGVRLTYCVAGLVALLLLGLGLVLGLGLGLKHKSSQNGTTGAASSPSPISTAPSSSSSLPAPPSSHSQSATSTSSSGPAPVKTGTHGLADNSCTFETPRTYHSPLGGDFTQYCFTAWPRDEDAADGDGAVHDLNILIKYTFEACMDECVKINKKHQDKGPPLCQAVTYNSNLTSSVELSEEGGNCFLKTKKGVNRQGTAESACAALVF